jgi:hypothetical protein
MGARPIVSPGSAAPDRGVARPARSDPRIAPRDHDEATVGEVRELVCGSAGQRGRHLDRRAAVDGLERPARSEQLDIERAGVSHAIALPGDEDPGGAEERQSQLDELAEGRDRPRRHGWPCHPIAPPGERLGSGGDSDDTRLEVGGGNDRREEPRLLGHRIDQERAVGRERRRKRHAREPAAASEIDEPIDRSPAELGQPGEAVDDVPDSDLGGIANRGEVDRGVPGEEQANVAVDGGPGLN